MELMMLMILNDGKQILIHLGARKTRWLRFVGAGLMSLALISLSGCPAPTPTPDKLGVLKTPLSGNLLLFSGAKRGVSVTQKLLLYNDGRVPVRIESMEIKGDTFSIFRVQPRIDKPITVKPGQANGIGFEIEFHPDSAGKFRATLVFASPNVENVDDDGNFLVHLYGQVLSDGGGSNGGVRLGCGGSLDFGKRQGPQGSDKSCELINETQKAIELTNLSYRRTLGGQSDFRWLMPLLPTKIEAGGRTTITIRYDGSAPKSEGTFQITTLPALPQGPLSLQVKGSTSP